MSINFSVYGVKSNDMNIDDLEVGQKLIRVFRPRHDSYDTVTTAEYGIVKVLKTRVVVAPVGGGNELRLLTDQRKWALYPGAVKTDIEGSTQGWHRASYEFATEDEAGIIADMKTRRDEELAKRRVKDSAKATVREIASQLYPELESVEKAIVALQALAAQLKAEDRS